MRQVRSEEGYRSWREREERWEGGQRGEGGTWQRGEQRGAPSPGGDGGGGGRKMGWGSHGVDGVGTGLVHHTSPPAPTWPRCRAGGQPGREHRTPKPIKCSRGHGPATWLPPIRRSEESVLICCLLITSDPALIPPKTSPESLQVTAGERRPPAGVPDQPGRGASPGPSGASGRDARGRQRCVVMEEAPCAPPSCSSARWS